MSADASLAGTKLRAAAAFIPPLAIEQRPQWLSPGTATMPVEGRGHASSTPVRGRVLIVRQGASEPMDFDLWRWVAIPVWGIVLIISPLAGAIQVWHSVGFLPALGVAACSLLVLRFIFSDRLLQSWHLTAAMNGRHIVEPMPVTMVRLRQADGREVQLRLKGQIAGGSLIEGDRVAAYGGWRSGVLHVRQIECERTGATIIPRQPCARELALMGIVVLVGICAWVYFAEIPWITGQFRSFRNTVENQVHHIIEGQRLP